MSELTIDLPADLLARLQHEAERAGKPASVLAGEWLSERLAAPDPPLERERVRAMLAKVGLLTELGPELQIQADAATLSLAEAQAILGRAGGQPLSEIVIEQRGPKV